MPADSLAAKDLGLPVAIVLGATFLFSITGAMVAIRRHYDLIGLFVLALACGLGGGLLRDGVFIQTGPRRHPQGAYIIMVAAGCLAAVLFFPHVERLVQAIPYD
jgi:uncharacterized membrane protein YeiH